MRYLQPPIPDGVAAAGWVVGGLQIKVDSPPQPLLGIEMALRGLAMITDWLDDADPDDAADVQAVLVGLGHVDSAALAALSGTIVQAETAGCGVADGHASPSSWVAQQLRMTGAAAARACRLAADLEDLPDVVAGLRDGLISRDHALTMAQALRQQRADQAAAAKARRDAQRREADRARAEAEAAEQAARDEEERQRIREEARLAEERRRAQAEEEERRRAEQAERDRTQRAADLLDAARKGRTPEDVAAEADRQRADDPDALVRSEAAARARRFVRTWRDRTTGDGCGRWQLPGVTHDRLEAALAAATTFDEPECEPDERRSPEQRRADALLDVVDQALRAGELPTSRGQKPHLTVTVSLDDLAPAEGGQPGRGRTRFGTTLSPQAVRRIACDAAFTRVVLNATGQVLDVGRATRFWTTAQHKAAEQTFGGCAFPVAAGKACGRPSGWCDLHHVQYWRNGGPTDAANGVLLCSRHHDAVHHDGWTLTYDHPALTVTVSRRRHDGSQVTRTVRYGDRHRRSTSRGPAAAANPGPAAAATGGPAAEATGGPAAEAEDRLPL